MPKASELEQRQFVAHTRLAARAQTILAYYLSFYVCVSNPKFRQILPSLKEKRRQS